MGVDEAGYAPKLGPLVVTVTSVERPAENADLYAMLSPAVASSRRTADAHSPKPLLIADSKAVYRPGAGLAELERGVISFLKATGLPGEVPATDLDLARAVSLDAPDLDGLPWYGGAPEPLPVTADPQDIELAAAGLTGAFSSAGCRPPRVRSRVVTARELNGAVAHGLNKAELLVEVVAGLLAAVWPDQETPGEASILVDRLGGRKDYSGLLAKAFRGAAVREESLSPTESCYAVTHADGRGPHGEVAFACRAESRCMTVALSSMVSKYVRELMMCRLNRWFAERLPGLRPTAGYPVDARRFLEDTRDFRRREGVRDADLIRSR